MTWGDRRLRHDADELDSPERVHGRANALSHAPKKAKTSFFPQLEIVGFAESCDAASVLSTSLAMMRIAFARS
jgi:hypothetical protein